MLDFFKTRAGRTFFDGSIPRLIKALERIASALEPQEPPKPAPPEDAYVTLAQLKAIETEIVGLPLNHDKTFTRGMGFGMMTIIERAEEAAHVPF